MVATKRAAVGLQEPQQRTLDGVPDVHTSIIDRPTEWTPAGEQPCDEADHDSASDFVPVSAAEAP